MASQPDRIVRVTTAEDVKELMAPTLAETDRIADQRRAAVAAAQRPGRLNPSAGPVGSPWRPRWP